MMAWVLFWAVMTAASLIWRGKLRSVLERSGDVRGRRVRKRMVVGERGRWIRVLPVLRMNFDPLHAYFRSTVLEFRVFDVRLASFFFRRVEFENGESEG